ncbi:MAG: serine hydrolase domain-containing protein, partial [Gemmatimonadales bacterium]
MNRSIVATLVVWVSINGLQARELAAQSELLRTALQDRLVALQTESGAPGATAGIVLGDGTVYGLAAGMSDTIRRLPMTASDRLLQGSVGKTYVAAVAIQLVFEGTLDLDAKISSYLANEPWFQRLPNHDAVTVRQLMNHTSGIIRYEFNEQFITDLLADPSRVWRPEEQLAYLFDTEAPFAAGDGWEYSDTNYIILGMIIERLTGSTYYDELQRRILDPLDLSNTV